MAQEQIGLGLDDSQKHLQERQSSLVGVVIAGLTALVALVLAVGHFRFHWF